jgi:hypothetical protein
MQRPLRGSLLLLVIALCLGSFLTAGAFAVFTDSADTPANAVSTGSLNPPGSLVATGGSDIVLDWDTSPSGNAAGYRILRANSPGGPYTEIDQVTPGSADTYTDSPGNGSFYYVIRSFFQNWESGDSAEVTATVGGGGSGPVAVASGSYTGDGQDDRAIGGAGFQPDIVIVSCDCGRSSIIRTSTMSGDASKVFTNNGALQPDRIQSLDADGFTVGRNNQVNRNGDTYYWVAIQAGSDISLGTYVGDGNDDRSISGIGFRPEWVITIGDGQQAWFRPDGASGDLSYKINNPGGAVNRIQDFTSDGFQIGSHNNVNDAGVTFHYIAFNASSSIEVGSYTGDGSDDRPITGLGIRPDFVWVKSDSGSDAVWRPDSLSGDATLAWDSGASPDRIQDLFNDGFEVGTDAGVNAAATTYYYLAIED